MSTPTPADPPAVRPDELYAYAVGVRNALDDDRDVNRDDLDNLLQVRKAYTYAADLGLALPADAPDGGSLNRDGARRLLDDLIPLIRAAVDHPANRPPPAAAAPVAATPPAPPAGVSPFAVDAGFQALGAYLQTLYADEWEPAAVPLWDALRPLRAAADGDDPVPDPAVWRAVGAAIRAAGVGDFPSIVLAHRQVPHGVRPTTDQVAEYAAWELFARAAADDPDGLATAVREARQWAADAPDPAGARDRLGEAVADAATALLDEWERRRTPPFVARLEAEAGRLGLTREGVLNWLDDTRLLRGGCGVVARLIVSSWCLGTAVTPAGRWHPYDEPDPDEPDAADAPPAEYAEAPTPATAVAATPGRKRRVPKGEAEVRVADWLVKYAKADPTAATVRRIAADTGVSIGNVGETAAWRSFNRKRTSNRRGPSGPSR